MATRPTKYAHVIKDLPKLPTVPPERKDLVDRVRGEILALPSPQEAATLWNASAQADEHERDAIRCVEQAIDVIKRLNGGKRSAAALAAGYAHARVLKDALKNLNSSAELLVDAFESLMLESMESEGVASLRLASGASVSTFGEPSGSVVDKEAFRLWCIANGYERQLQLWPSTMNAIVKERTLDAAPPPDGVEVYVKTTVRLNKA